MPCGQPKGAEKQQNSQGIFYKNGFQKRYPLDRISPADFPADFPINFPADFPADSPADFLSRFPSKFPSRFPSKNFPAEFPVEEKDEQCYWFEGWFSREFSGKIRVWVRAKQGMIPQLDLLTPNEADEKTWTVLLIWRMISQKNSGYDFHIFGHDLFKQFGYTRNSVRLPETIGLKKYEQCYWFERWFLRKFPGKISTVPREAKRSLTPAKSLEPKP